MNGNIILLLTKKILLLLYKFESSFEAEEEHTNGHNLLL